MHYFSHNHYLSLPILFNLQNTKSGSFQFIVVHPTKSIFAIENRVEATQIKFN